MAENPLIKKLRLMPGQRAAFLNAPAGYVVSLGDLPSGIVATDEAAGPLDFVQLFVYDSGELAAWLPSVLSALKPDGLLWICYPKTTSGIETDLTRDAGWEPVAKAGLRGVANIAIDDTWSALRFRPVEAPAGGDPVAAQYAGPKVGLRPVYDRLVAAVAGFGPDIELQARQTYVALVRGKQFAVIQPSTKTRVDVGLKLPGIPFGGRLQPSAGTGSGSMTHRVSLTSTAEVDDELIDWLRAAYEGVA